MTYLESYKVSYQVNFISSYMTDIITSLCPGNLNEDGILNDHDTFNSDDSSDCSMEHQDERL